MGLSDYEPVSVPMYFITSSSMAWHKKSNIIMLTGRAAVLRIPN
jgi:hypothetical protein